ncbi:MAG: Endo-alpha-mannosidase, partial [Armatimonadetes bacterium]|nr:Endo-alpha-mannosidase [Armatimonadota bacterium]
SNYRAFVSMKLGTSVVGKQAVADFTVRAECGREALLGVGKLPLSVTDSQHLLVVRPRPDRVSTQKPLPLVFALYYPWYGVPTVTGSYRHYGAITPAGISGFPHSPATGPYDSHDEATIQRQLSELKAGGVDVIVCSWWGPGSFEDRAMQKVFTIAQRTGLQTCMMLEPYKRWSGANAIERELRVWSAVAEHPAYLRVEGRPVLFVSGAVKQQVDPAHWSEAVTALEASSGPGILLAAPGETALDFALYDALFPPALPERAANRPASQLRGFLSAAQARSVESTSRRNRIAIGITSPGLDLRTPATRTGALLNRADGATYREFWSSAIAASPHWVLIRSYNHWESGTEIEPSREHGTTYLDLTREYTAQLKRSRKPAAVE